MTSGVATEELYSVLWAMPRGCEGFYPAEVNADKSTKAKTAMRAGVFVP